MEPPKEKKVVEGCKGGGLPEFEEVAGILTQGQFREIEEAFNSAYREFAGISEGDDGLNASETTYDDACGFLIFSDCVLTFEEVASCLGGALVYFLGHCRFGNFYVYWGVLGV